ncbi:MAG: type IV pilus twitching motility protein PilT [Elusimicrobiota bacterium]
MDLPGLIQKLAQSRGSDLHVRAGGPAYLRVDGELSQAAPEALSEDQIKAMLASVATPRAKKIFEQNGECDFSFEVAGAARFRVNAFRQRQRLCLAVRLIPMRIPTLDELRLPVATMKKIADNGRGLVLMTGVTGSGKSSTLAAMIDHINETRAEHVITIEDPIEFVHRDKKSIVSQREIGDDTVNYAEGLRMALRQDPDVIMVGEMRDLETASAALTAAQTGHLVFATMHTIDSMHTITRIVDLYPQHQQHLIRLQLAESLKAVVSQRLVRSASGGRVAALEILIVTAHVRKLIEDNNSASIAEACAKGQFYGMQTFNQSLVKLFKDGLATEAAIMEAATSPDDVKLALRGIDQDMKQGG